MSQPAPRLIPLAAIAPRLAVILLLVGLYSTTVGLILLWSKVKFQEWGAEAGLVNGIILGLLMGFRNRAAYDRWWEGRRLWGQLINETRNLAYGFAAFLPVGDPARIRAGRLLAAYPESLRRQLQEETPPRREDLTDLAAEPAADAVASSDPPPHLPNRLTGELLSLCAELLRSGKFGDETFRATVTRLQFYPEICGGCERLRRTPVVPSYKALLRVGLLLHVLVAPWYTLAELGLWGLPVLLLVCFFLFGVELIDSAVEEPFGRTSDDLDLDALCRTARTSVREALPDAFTGPDAGPAA